MLSWMQDDGRLVLASSKEFKVDMTVNHVCASSSTPTSCYNLSVSDWVSGGSWQIDERMSANTGSLRSKWLVKLQPSLN